MKYYKMNGLGNNFYIFDLRQINNYSIEELFKLTNLKFDQLILLKQSDKANCYMEIYNIDKSKVEACGNATRCVAKILMAEENSKQVEIETQNRILIINKIADKYQVMMGKPKTYWQDIPLISALDKAQLTLLDQTKFSSGFCVNIGNPHIVFFTNNIKQVSLLDEVAWLEKHEFFPQSININIAELVNKSTILLKTWERGAGATKACGTGACATFYAAFKNYKINNMAEIIMPGGKLEISINKKQEIFMLGDANLEETYDLN